ncbi:carbohydrate ABC transporter permease [Paenibacillus elgii]
MNLLKDRKIYFLLVVPALMFYTFSVLGPLFFGTIPLSLYKWNMLNPIAEWIGLKNYVQLFTDDPKFWGSFVLSIQIGIFTIIISNVLALSLALVLNENLFFKNAIRSMFFIPHIISSIFAALIWVFVFTGLFPSILQSLNMDFLNISWFGTPEMAMTSIVIVTVWQSTGFLMLMYLAGLQTIPKDVMESAYLDGVSMMQKIKQIQLPLLMPTITINLFLSIAGAFKQFDVPIALTGGGPHKSTETVAFDIYSEAFKNFNLGYSSSKAVILLLTVCLISYIQMRWTRKREINL